MRIRYAGRRMSCPLQTANLRQERDAQIVHRSKAVVSTIVFLLTGDRRSHACSCFFYRKTCGQMLCDQCLVWTGAAYAPGR
jgi:hypothetical protein